MKTTKIKRIIYGIFTVTAVTALLGLSKNAGGTVHAAPEKMRVGFQHIAGYQERTEDGSPRGYGYDYLSEIAKYTGWKYEFVDASWDACLTMLANGELDLVTCASFNEERREIYEYSPYQMGLSHTILTVRPDNDQYFYNDFQNFGGMKVGLIKGNAENSAVDTLYEEYNVSLETVMYSTEAEAKRALAAGDVDALITSSLRLLENEKLVGAIDSRPIYTITGKGNTELMQTFGKAQEQMLLANPYFEADLYQKYLANNIGYKVALSREEADYIKENKTIRVAVSSDTEPLYYFDGQTYKGMIVDSLQAMAEEVGLEVEYVVTASDKESIEALKAGTVDVVPDFYADYVYEEQNHVLMSKPYLEMQYIEISSKTALPKKEETIVAACPGCFLNDLYIKKHYSDESIIYYQSEKECVEAVRNKKADVTFVNQYTARLLLGEDRNLRLNGNIIYDAGHGIAIAVSEDNPTLYRIMNKAITNQNPETFSQIVDNYSSGTEKVSLQRYVYDNLFQVVLIGFAVFCLIIIVLLYIEWQRRKYEKHLYELAYKDTLTGLGNVKQFEDLASKRWLEYRGQTVCLISMDISHFTTINETYGRAVGDQVICYAGQMLSDLFSKWGIVARNEVDNFFLLGVCDSEERLNVIIKDIKEKIGTFRYEGDNGFSEDINITYNFGIVREKCTGSTSIKKLIDRAQMARKSAKKTSSHVRIFNDEMEKQLLREKIIEDNMESALANGEFAVYYQPKYCMTDNRIIGAEALVRWNSKEYGFMRPDEFIPIFENNGFIVELDFYIMEKVYEMLRLRLDQGKKTVRVSINQSRMHFAQKNYIERLNALREKYQIPDELIELELTESIFADIHDIRTVVEQLKENRYYLSMDDFGSGYSSLNMIKEIPLDTLKIDKSFLEDDVTDSDRYQKVVKKVVELAKDLNMEIICEGVEKPTQAEFLQSVGCIYAQGFLYARPMPEKDFSKLLG